MEGATRIKLLTSPLRTVQNLPQPANQRRNRRVRSLSRVRPIEPTISRIVRKTAPTRISSQHSLHRPRNHFRVLWVRTICKGLHVKNTPETVIAWGAPSKGMPIRSALRFTRIWGAVRGVRILPTNKWDGGNRQRGQS